MSCSLLIAMICVQNEILWPSNCKNSRRNRKACSNNVSAPLKSGRVRHVKTFWLLCAKCSPIPPIGISANGIHEGGNLTYTAMETELQQLRSSLEDANAKAELFIHKSSHTAAQLDLLKDLFTKMAVQP